MPLKKLDNLVQINQLKHEPPDQKEFDGMVASAKLRLHDARVKGIKVSPKKVDLLLPMEPLTQFH